MNVVARNPERLVSLSVCGHEDRGKHEVVRIFWIERQRLLRVRVALDRIAFGVPVHGKVAIRERQRKFFDCAFHQREAFLKLAIVNRHLAEPVQRDRARKRIRGHIQDRFKCRARFVPGADVVAIIFAEVAQRSWVRRIHQVGFRVQLVSEDILRIRFRKQTAPHRRFDQSTLARLEYRSRRHAGDLTGAEILELLGGFLGLLRKQTFLIKHGAVNLDRRILVAGFHFVGRIFQLAVEGAFALLHLALDNLFHVGDFKLAVCVLDFAHRRALSSGQNSNRQL